MADSEAVCVAVGCMKTRLPLFMDRLFLRNPSSFLSLLTLVISWTLACPEK